MDGIKSQKSKRDIFVAPITEGQHHDQGAVVDDGAPVLCTEFGGINIAPRTGEEAKEGDWGYTTASDGRDLLKRIEGMVMGIVNGGICSGFVYTQL